ncbi:MAG: type VI secretion system baseplate subunit TssK, partial [Myxococcota bacterium]
VHAKALDGVRLRRSKASHLRHTFGARADIFRLDQGHEWQHAVREGALCFYAASGFNQARFALSWL